VTRAASLEQIRCEWVAARAPALHASHLIYFYVFLMCDSEGWRRVTGVLDWGGADGRPRLSRDGARRGGAGDSFYGGYGKYAPLPPYSAP
jgi:hypothetical protein